MHRKHIARLRQVQVQPPIDSRQLTLNWANT
jgi:hypothetical protein